MTLYRSVYGYGEAEYIIERSRFIAHVSPAESPEEARLFIADIKDRYRDATHNVPAFVCGAGASISGRVMTVSRKVHPGCPF